MTTEVWWSPSFPYSSSLTGQSAQELADAYTAATARPWTMALGQKHALFEVIADVVKRTEDLDDPSAIVEAIARTKLNTVAGPIEWTGKPVRNVAKTPVVVGQWQKEADNFSLVIVDNTMHPEIPVVGELQLMS
jgi:branched-chain amino acid transport system substrate-binding protein